MVFENTAPRAFSALSRSVFSSCRAATQSLARPALLATTTTTTALFSTTPRSSSPSSSFSTTAARSADDDFSESSGSAADVLSTALPINQRPTSNYSGLSDIWGRQGGVDYQPGEAPLTAEPEPHHLHILATKHNTHLTLTRPNRDCIISISAGNLGFRKAGRNSYDAAYQLTAYMLSQIQERGLLMDIKRLELVFRGFGEGREAVRKALMGSEGINIRNRVVRVTDTTRLKFGGTRSKKPRRLG